jgi:hypothetical protein
MGRRPIAPADAAAQTARMDIPLLVSDFACTTPQCTTPTIEEIRHAEQLRREIERRYLARPDRPSDPYWCVGAD